jgi:erythronate-4-phosphate dehydrogenase
MPVPALTILADENIALVDEAFAPLGTLRTVPGRSITPAMVADVDVLLVRSITRVDAALLARSRCQFVGTATSGTDHIDLAWLEEQGITFADAHGCNAEGVVDYVLTALAFLAARDGTDWTRRSIGIVGCGAVGSRLAKRALALGMQVRIHDPFLDGSHTLAACFSSLEDVLQQEIVSLHIPLTHTGPWPTFHLLNSARLALLRSDGILINAARGAVLDTQALLSRMTKTPALQVVLDAWEAEPAVNIELLARVQAGTPHIAGYSRLGKLRGTQLLLDALHRYLGRGTQPPLYKEDNVDLDLTQLPKESDAQFRDRCILTACDLAGDHAAMQLMLHVPPAQAALDFDCLRKTYVERAEFGQCVLRTTATQGSVVPALRAVGFTLR